MRSDNTKQPRPCSNRQMSCFNGSENTVAGAHNHSHSYTKRVQQHNTEAQLSTKGMRRHRSLHVSVLYPPPFSLSVCVHKISHLLNWVQNPREEAKRATNAQPHVDMQKSDFHQTKLFEYCLCVWSACKAASAATKLKQKSPKNEEISFVWLRFICTLMPCYTFAFIQRIIPFNSSSFLRAAASMLSFIFVNFGRHRCSQRNAITLPHPAAALISFALNSLLY